MKTYSSLRFVFFLLWSSAVFFTALFLFAGGFLLRRHELPNKSACLNSTTSCNSVPRQYSKSVVIIIDALKYEFALYNDSLRADEAKPFQNRLPILHAHPGGRLFEFVADPPTTTMQRLKGLTTGNLPTFVDVSSNFASYEITEDNIIDQLVNQGRKVVFAGDDTWMGLFPDRFSRAYPFPSFDVWDLDTVDTGVTKHLFQELKNPQGWDVLIGHYLGVDHAGHKYGPNHDEMRRKLEEMNTVLDHVISNLPDDCILFVMGDHGMTTTGDHGGDSAEELSAALYMYSKKSTRKLLNSTVTVNQVDFVPTFSLLLGLPIPFSNVGAVISDAVNLIADGNDAATTLKQLQYIGINVDQVFHYLETYQQLSVSSEVRASPLQASYYEKAISQVAHFRNRRSSVLKPADATSILQLGSGLLSQVKSMCQSAFVEFNLPRITSGLTLSFLHVCLLTVLALVPKNLLLRRFISLDLLAGLGLALIVGAGLVLMSLFLKSGDHPAPDLFAFGVSVSISLMFFGFTLLWRLRNSISEIFQSLFVTDIFCWLHYALYGFLVAGLFSNSFVVNEASLVSYCVATSVALHAFATLTRPVENEGQRRMHFLLALALMGLLRCMVIYFRCREEQQGYCQPTDYHKAIGTLPQNVSREYKNFRFFFTIFSVYSIVQLPYLWLKMCGNLNGMSIPVMTTGYTPWFAGIVMICHWAIQALPAEMAAEFLPWRQQSVLAQVAWAACFLTILLVPVCCPNLTYFVREQRRREIPKAVDDVGTFYNLIKSNWREHFAFQASSRHRTIYGMGTALSAPFIVLSMVLGLASMLVLGDGLCPSMAVAVIGGGLYLYLTAVKRLDRVSGVSKKDGDNAESRNGFDLMQTPWSVVMGWYFLECLFFYGSGHQATFPTIQWSSAFVVPSDDSGGLFRNHILPAFLIGWNTFAFRVLFGILLPLLMLSPFAIWMLKYSSQMKSEEAEQINGEMFLVEHEDEAKAQLFRLCTKYFVLQGVRLFAAMLSAAVLRRHLMVWKIFAPRFIFEGIGFTVSAVAILLGYALYVRIQNVMSGYLREVCEKEK